VVQLRDPLLSAPAVYDDDATTARAAAGGSATTWIDRTDEDEARHKSTATNRRNHEMPDSQAQTPAQRAIGDFAPKLVTLTDDVLFGDVWERPELSKRDRSLVTVAALVSNGSTEQLKSHLVRAKDNGLTEAELKEAIIHLAF
jgi:4-carboxymuconolactone decarboxylase